MYLEYPLPYLSRGLLIVKTVIDVITQSRVSFIFNSKDLTVLTFR